MKALIIYLTLSIFIVLFTSGSCHKGDNCEEPPNVNVSDVVISFIDNQTGRYLYTETNPFYSKDSLKAFDDGGNQLLPLYALNQIPNSLSRYYVVSLGPIYNFQTDGNSFNIETCKKFIIMYTYNETDTVNICFKSKTTKCGSVFETLKIFHEGILIGSTTNKTYILVTVYKN